MLTELGWRLQPMQTWLSTSPGDLWGRWVLDDTHLSLSLASDEHRRRRPSDLADDDEVALVEPDVETPSSSRVSTSWLAIHLLLGHSLRSPY